MYKSLTSNKIQRHSGVTLPLIRRFWMRTSCTVLGLLALAPGAFAQDAPPTGVVIIQESNGFPGGEQSTQLARQQLTIVDQRLRVLDEAHGWALYVALPERKVTEVSIGAREYVERPFTYYEKYRADRARALQEQATEFTQQRDRVQDEARELRALESEYTRMGGDTRRPGHVTARIEQFPGDRRTVKLLVNREEREVALDHIKIRENNAADPVFDLWVTRDVTLPVDVLAFWRALGTFAPEVSEKLLQVNGTIVECTAVLDTGSFKRRFQSRVLEVRTQDIGIDVANVTPPQGGAWAAVDPDSRPTALPADAPRAWCMMTGVPIEAGREVVFVGPDRRRYTVVDATQRAALIVLLGEGKHPPYLRGPSTGGGR
jgi:hypothetical protein